MKVIVNDNCIKCMACIDNSNNAFMYDEKAGKIRLADGVDPDKRKDDIKVGADNCPVLAIEIIE